MALLRTRAPLDAVAGPSPEPDPRMASRPLTSLEFTPTEDSPPLRVAESTSGAERSIGGLTSQDELEEEHAGAAQGITGDAFQEVAMRAISSSLHTYLNTRADCGDTANRYDGSRRSAGTRLVDDPEALEDLLQRVNDLYVTGQHPSVEPRQW